MSHEICQLDPGEELMDQQTFGRLFLTLDDARSREDERRAQAAEPTTASRQAPPASCANPAAPRRHATVAGATPVTPSPSQPVPRARVTSPAAPGAGVITCAPSVAPAAALEAEIARCDSPEAAARLAVHLARSYTSAAALFLVRHGVISGIASSGLDSRERGVLMAADTHSIFAHVAASGRAVRGAPGGTALDQRVIHALGRDHVQEFALLPVALGGGVVNLLYADNGPQRLGDAPLAALGTICAHLSRAYERLIRDRKRTGGEARS